MSYHWSGAFFHASFLGSFAGVPNFHLPCASPERLFDKCQYAAPRLTALAHPNVKCRMHEPVSITMSYPCNYKLLTLKPYIPNLSLYRPQGLSLC